MRPSAAPRAVSTARERSRQAVTQLHQAAKGNLVTNRSARGAAAFQILVQDLSLTTPLQLSLVAWSIARLVDRDPRTIKDEDYTLFLDHMLQRASELDVPGVSMVMWSLAKLPRDSVSTRIFQLLADRALFRLPELDAQGLSNVVWSCAVVRQQQIPLIHAIQDKRLLFSASTQSAANIVWATSQLTLAGCPLQEDAALVASQRIRELRPEELAAVVWALAAQRLAGRQRLQNVIHRLVWQATRVPQVYGSKVLAAAAWSLATLIVREIGFWRRVERAALGCCRDHSFQPQELANVFWALATSGAADSTAAPLWQSLAHLAVGRKEEFGATELAAISWAMAAQRFVFPAWSSAVTASLHLYELNLRGLASIAWSWVTLRFETSLLLDSVEHAHQLLPAYWTAWPSLPNGDGSVSRVEAFRELINPLLQLTWSLSFAGGQMAADRQHRARIEVLPEVLALLQHVGTSWDFSSSLSTSLVPLGAQGVREVGQEGIAEGSEAPKILCSLPGLVFLLKPPGWEIDGGRDAERSADVPKMSSFLQQHFAHRPVLRASWSCD